LEGFLRNYFEDIKKIIEEIWRINSVVRIGFYWKINRGFEDYLD
jgi:hypothetical protein